MNSELTKRIEKTRPVSVSSLQMNSISRNNIRKTAIAINEVSLLRQSRQAASLQITNKNKKIIKKLICDGVLICTPATLIALLKGISFNWQQESLAKNVKEIALSSQELQVRILKFFE